MCYMCALMLQHSGTCLFSGSAAATAAQSVPSTGTAMLGAALPGSGSAILHIGGGSQITADTRYDGNLGNGSTDHLTVQLVAGEAYVFRLWGTGGSNAALTDPVLALRDGSGNVVASNDDASSNNAFSLIEFTAAASGSYQLDISGYGGSGGQYAVDMTGDVLTAQQVATQLVDFGWGIPTEIAFDAHAGSTLTVNLTGLAADERQLAQWALDVWSLYSGLHFQTTTGSADISFGDSGSGAYGGPTAYYPSTGEVMSAQVVVGSSWVDTYGSTVNSYSFLTYLHEIGHALGLTHPGNYDGSAHYGTDNYYLNDSTQMSVMSYFDPDENGFIDDSLTYPVTPMIADILAIQMLYGTAQVQNGNTVWGANSTVSGLLGQIQRYAFGGATPDPNLWAGSGHFTAPVAMTVLDTGGTDTLDLSTQTAAQRIDLRPEAVSDIAGETGNLVIAAGTTIEHVYGGAGADNITGNDADNQIRGNGGDDSVHGGLGSDRIVGGGGNDRLWGDSAGDTLLGGYGSDTLRGGGGNDTIRGDANADQLFGDGGNDSVRGGGGDDRIDGGADHDWLHGDAGNDRICGGADGDKLFGESGADKLFGGDGTDKLYGGDGNDILFGNDQSDGLHGQGNNDTLYGGGQNDTLYGDGGNDRLLGENGMDQLFGGDGNDRLNGGAQDDRLNGGAGADVFLFRAGTGDDRVQDFQNGLDRLDLCGLGFASVADVRAAAQDHGGDLVIDLGNGDSVTVLDFTRAQLDDSDLIL
jgi:serralysin